MKSSQNTESANFRGTVCQAPIIFFRSDKKFGEVLHVAKTIWKRWKHQRQYMIRAQLWIKDTPPHEWSQTTAFILYLYIFFKIPRFGTILRISLFSLVRAIPARLSIELVEYQTSLEMTLYSRSENPRQYSCNAEPRPNFTVKTEGCEWRD